MRVLRLVVCMCCIGSLSVMIFIVRLLISFLFWVCFMRVI